jgi:hypothetical protein
MDTRIVTGARDPGRADFDGGFLVVNLQDAKMRYSSQIPAGSLARYASLLALPSTSQKDIHTNWTSHAPVHALKPLYTLNGAHFASQQCYLGSIVPTAGSLLGLVVFKLQVILSYLIHTHPLPKHLSVSHRNLLSSALLSLQVQVIPCPLPTAHSSTLCLVLHRPFMMRL